MKRLRPGLNQSMLLRLAAGLMLPVLLWSCTPPLVNESYATMDHKSINGVDAFHAMLQGTKHKVSVNAYLSSDLLREADLIVHFEKRARAAELRRVEAWLMGVKLKKKKDDDVSDHKPDDQPDKKPGVPKDHDKPDNDVGEPQDVRFRVPRKQLQDTGDDPDSKDDDSHTGDKGAKGKTPVRRKRVVLYFVRDTDASVNFWTRVAGQMPADSDERKFCRAHAENRAFRRGTFPGSGRILFGMRSIKYEQGIYARGFYYDKKVFPDGVAEFPVRGSTRLRSKADSELDYARAYLGARVLLSTVNGDFLVYEMKLKNGILLLVYNSEPFLNFSLVRKKYRRLSKNLIDYAARRARALRPDEMPGGKKLLSDLMQDRGKDRALRIAFVENSLVTAEDVTRSTDDLIKRLLFSFPINVILLHVMGILILFLIARWPHEKAPIKLPEVGERAYIEHIHALGEKMAVSRSPGPAVEALARYLRMDAPEITDPSSEEEPDRDAEQGILGSIARLWDAKRK